ncbi:MAG: hypothetical protein QNK23_11440 [Crocinitomicaceae bacterium]|nr:hypothetical protein [Crocinitomicaceae bacterium]
MRLFLSLVSLVITSFAFSQTIDMSIFEDMEMRQIGPAGMSGRVTCIDVVQSEPNTIYIGAASGGVWKSTSGGTTWEPIGDTMPTMNIGALAIQQSNPSVIWVGTGEGNPRNSQSSGYGIYKSINGGRTWECMGLEETRNIHRVIVHPTDPNTVWVGAQGPAWGDNPNRGVYKTIDGGESWRLVLEGNESTGVGDLVIDPTNPNKLIANLWDFRRDAWFFRSGGEGSGLFVSFDGGETWEQRTEEDGLPKGELGRIGLAISPSNPNRIYAKIEAKSNDLYRSDDGGFKWIKISSDENAGDRPFYYSDIFVDPINENRVYSLWSRVSMSEDGGITWKVIIPYWGVHPDHHAFWVHPTDPNYVIIGNDGGMAISRDRTETWRFVENLPIAQYYHINIDDELPYNVYGGMQDNGSWRGPAYVWASGGIRNAYFTELAFGDGFDVSPDPDMPGRFGYAMSQGGWLVQYDILTGYTKGIKPTIADTTELRFNWNAPLAQDPFDNSTIYYGSQFVHKSTTKGDSWETISPDLTTNDTTKQHQMESGGLTYDVTGAENYTCLTVIAPSPVKQGVIWTGSDDGRLHLTTDGGATWTSLEGKLKMPEGAWIPQIHPSAHNADEVFVVVNDYRRNNWEPYLFHSTNAGKSFERIASSEDFPGYCLSVVQDPVEEDLIFVGTEHGLYVSFNHGEDWQQWQHGYPNVSTMDLKIQERERDLVIGTFGRSAYVLDDISPLRDMAANGVGTWDEEQLKVFEIPTAYHVEYRRAPGTRFGADATWEGENRTSAARVQVYFDREMKEDDKKDATTEGFMRVYNEEGDTLRTIKIKLGNGMNRLSWGLDSKRVRGAHAERPKKDDDEWGGIPVLPGIYTIEVECDSIKSSQQVEVKLDPRTVLAMADAEQQKSRFDKVQKLVEDVADLANELRDGQEAIKKITSWMPEEQSDELKEIVKLGKQMNDTIQGMLELIIGKQDVKGIFREDNFVMAKVNMPLWTAWGTLSGNEQAFENYFKKAVEAYEQVNTDIQHFFENEWKEYKAKIESLDLSPFREE